MFSIWCDSFIHPCTTPRNASAVIHFIKSLLVALIYVVVFRPFSLHFWHIASIDSLGCCGDLFNIVLRFCMLSTAQHDVPAQKRWNGNTIKFSLCKKKKKTAWLLTRHFQQFDSVLHAISYGVRAMHEYIYHQRCRICTLIRVFKLLLSYSMIHLHAFSMCNTVCVCCRI